MSGAIPGREDACVVAHHDEIWVVGGRGRSNKIFSDVWKIKELSDNGIKAACLESIE